MKRQERLKQLEKEREFYAKVNQSQSPQSRPLQDDDDAGQQQQNDTTTRPRPTNSNFDFSTIKQRLGINTNNTGLPLPSQQLVEDIFKFSCDNHNVDKLFSINTNSNISSPQRPQKVRVDAFDKIALKDYRVRQKYHLTDKNLLEDERARNAALEDSYAQLLRQVQQLQNTHLVDLRNSEMRFHAASAALQKALVAKSEELVGISNKLASSDGRYERDSRDWQKERVSFLAQIETLSTASAAQITRIADREHRLMEMNKLRKELAERIAGREQDLIKYGKALRDREADFLQERETRIKMENKATNLEKHQAERDAQFRDLQTQLHKKILETEELAGLKIVFNEAKRDIEDYSRREKYYNTEIEQMANRERQLFSQVEQLTATERKYAQELARLGDRQAALVKDLEERQAREERISQTLHDCQTKLQHQESELGKSEKHLRQSQLDNSRLLQEYSSLQATAQEAQLSTQTLTKNLLISTNNEEVLQKERDNALAKIAALSKDFGAKQRESEDQKQEIRQLSERLEAEKQSQNDMRQQSKEKFGIVTTKITELQDTLIETQAQLAELRANEKAVRGTLRQKEESMKAQNVVLADAEAKIQELLSSTAKEAIEFEQFKNKKRDEILAIQDKYTQAKQAMDYEVTQLRHQLHQKQTQYSSLSEEFGELKAAVSELSGAKLALENRISEMTSTDTSQTRQIANLTSTITTKTQEIARLSAKHSSLLDQQKRTDEELAMYRENNSTARDADINRLQSNMEEISKRLKSQVDDLMDKDADSTTFSHTRSISASSTVSPTRPRTGPGSKYLPGAALESFNDDFENLDRLLNRSKMSSLDI